VFFRLNPTALVETGVDVALFCARNVYVPTKEAHLFVRQLNYEDDLPNVSMCAISRQAKALLCFAYVKRRRQ
jgi:hypothetical protein